MKQLSIIVFAAVALMFTACGGAEKKAEEAKDAAKEVVQEVKEEVTASASETTLKAYEELITKIVDVTKKAQAGDANSVQEMMKLNEEATKFAETHKDAMANFTAEDQAKYAEIAQKLVDAATKK